MKTAEEIIDKLCENIFTTKMNKKGERQLLFKNFVFNVEIEQHSDSYFRITFKKKKGPKLGYSDLSFRVLKENNKEAFIVTWPVIHFTEDNCEQIIANFLLKKLKAFQGKTQRELEYAQQKVRNLKNNIDAYEE